MLDYITSYLKSDHHAGFGRQHVLGIRVHRFDLPGSIRRRHRDELAGAKDSWRTCRFRLGPMRVGPHGLLQPIADALKLLNSRKTSCRPRPTVGLLDGRR